ncbi:TPA: tail fiber assembly protein [Escherichia coli]|nr:Tail fiber assembly protein [Escherichia coli SCD1]HAN8005897.1 tail fiber assembly protein [Escherichia coli]HBU7861993.1 tail fiber assembly protein [Escherichia coli]
MNYAFSPTENTFYCYDWKSDFDAAGTWPADAVDISDEVYLEYSGNPPVGKTRVAGDDGLPEWADIPPLTKEDLIAATEYERQRRIDVANDFMNSKQWPGKAAIGRLKGDELTQYNLWLDYLDALEAVDTSSAPDIKWPTPPGEQAS